MPTANTPSPGAFVERLAPGRFDGQTVVVTGAGAGIGKAVALRVAREGGRVVAADWNGERLAELAAAYPDLDLVTVRGDIGEEADVQRIAQACGGRCDALANNAGIMDGFEPAGEVSDAVWDRVMRVNVTGTLRMTRAILPLMLAARRGRIVNVVSVAGIVGASAGAAYTASKHAVVGLTRSTAFMYEPDGIRCNAVAPAGVATSIEFSFASQRGEERITPRMQVATREAAPEETAAAITFLLSNDSPNVNGAILPSDSGWTAF